MLNPHHGLRRSAASGLTIAIFHWTRKGGHEKKEEKRRGMADCAQAEALLRQATGQPALRLRDGQCEAIDRLVNQRARALVVQRTGWGKSMVYFLATKLLRDQDAGPTLIISPLLALMRNQLDAAKRLGLRAATINSANVDEWNAVKEELFADRIDLLLISPERLANDGFVADVLIPIAERVGLLVVDEAHCISDWGHDFRPDYRRIVDVLRLLPPNIAVLATTATANRRVVADVETQLGPNTQTLRGPLMRESIRLQALHIADAATRLAWLADHVPELPGSGIVYTLTVRDADRVADWLRQQGVDAAAYYSGAGTAQGLDSNAYRKELERRLLGNELKCLVATTALGMGFDKPDLGFVIHYQMPASVVHYYQQVGRAGRAIPEAFGILLAGDEDSDINEYFRETAFPPEWQVERILNALAQATDGLTERELEQEVNLRTGQIEKVLKILSVDANAPLAKDRTKWFRTINAWKMDHERIGRLAHQREREWEQMQDYLSGRECLMKFLANALDDELQQPCGRCAVCLGAPLIPVAVRLATLQAAQRYCRVTEMPLVPKKQMPRNAFAHYGWGGNIPQHLQAEEGRVLARWGETGWGELARVGKQSGRFGDELVAGTVEMIRNRWPAAQGVRWITCVPSLRHANLVGDFAARLAASLGLPFYPVIQKSIESEPQKLMENRYHQCRNLDGVFAVEPGSLDIRGPVLLVDDVTDSGWTIAVIARLLRQAGSGAVYPLALASATAS
jgi:ATP-dependent DNA helicase RecQ